MGIQLTPGQRCLLDLLQRKLISTIQAYAKLRTRRIKAINNDCHGGSSHSDCQPDVNESELIRLREKIKRISARQKRFTSEIISGNGNNTIPKESFFRALGLVTKETLEQLNSKSNERRRRTTANPRFSHEAIQAKKALQKSRLEPRSVRDKREPARGNSNKVGTNNNNSNSHNRNSNRELQNKQESSNKSQVNVSSIKSVNNGGNNDRLKEKQRQKLEILSEEEKASLYEEFRSLHRLIDTKSAQVKDKIAINRRLEAENEKIHLALSRLKEDGSLKSHDDIRHLVKSVDLAHLMKLSLTSQDTSDSQEVGGQEHVVKQQEGRPAFAIHRSLDTWFKCDESLDGLD